MTWVGSRVVLNAHVVLRSIDSVYPFPPLLISFAPGMGTALSNKRTEDGSRHFKIDVWALFLLVNFKFKK